MTAPRRHPNVIHADDVPPIETARGKHRHQRRRLGSAAGSAQLGASLMELPPGGVSFPRHWHGANEEGIFIVSGTGTARIGDARVAVRAGDWIALPIGPEHAHQMINDGAAPLIYLCVSTNHTCEVVGYPDSKKLAAMAGPSWEQLWVRQIVRDESLDYYDGEPEA